MIKIIAWIVGICAAIAIYIGFDVLLKVAEIPTYIDFGETITVTRGSGPMSYEEDIDGESTTAGIVIMILSIMIASRIGMAIYHKNISGGLDKKGKIEFNAWFVGLSLVLVGASVLFTVREKFENEWYINVLFNIVEIALVGGVFVLMKKWRERRFSTLVKSASHTGV